MSAVDRMHIGSQTNAWRIDSGGLDSLLGVLRTLKQLDFEGFETSFLNLRNQFEHPDAARTRLEETGLRFFGIHVFLASYDSVTALAPFELLREVADGGAALGAERLIVSGGSTPEPAALSRKVAAVDRIAHYCHTKGLRLAYHNHGAEFEEQGAQINRLIQETDTALVRFVLDTGHAIEGGGNVPEFFQRHHGRIDGLHLRDSRAGQEVPFGHGEYDWAPLAAAIRASNWSGWLLTEEERRNGDKPGEAAIGPARAMVRKVFGA